MDIKQQLRYFIALPIDTAVVPLAWNNLCLEALRQIEAHEQTIRGLQRELNVDRLTDDPDMRAVIAAQCMAAMMGSDYPRKHKTTKQVSDHGIL